LTFIGHSLTAAVYGASSVLIAVSSVLSNAREGSQLSLSVKTPSGSLTFKVLEARLRLVMKIHGLASD
jgi:hypothetical protein